MQRLLPNFTLAACSAGGDGTCFRRFAWACYAGEQVVPNDSSLAVLPLSLQDRMLSAPHLNYFASQVQEKKSQLRIERSKFFPEFSLGYVRQKLLR